MMNYVHLLTIAFALAVASGQSGIDADSFEVPTCQAHSDFTDLSGITSFMQGAMFMSRTLAVNLDREEVTYMEAPVAGTFGGEPKGMHQEAMGPSLLYLCHKPDDHAINCNPDVLTKTYIKQPELPSFTFLDPSFANDPKFDATKVGKWKDWCKQNEVEVKPVEFKTSRDWVPMAIDTDKLTNTAIAVTSLIPPSSNETAVEEVVGKLCRSGPCYDAVVSVACPEIEPDIQNLVRQVLKEGGNYYQGDSRDCKDIDGFQKGTDIHVSHFVDYAYCVSKRKSP